MAAMVFLTAASAPALGQQGCPAEYELIYRLRAAEYASYPVWDTVYGGPKAQERFAAGLVMPEGNFIAAGERRPAGAAPDSDAKLVTVRLDRRGRTVWEREGEAAGLRDILKIIADGEGYVLLGRSVSNGRQGVWTGFLDGEGHLVSFKTLRHPQGDLIARDLIAAGDKGFFLAATLEKGPYGRGHALLYRLNGSGEALWNRAYVTGVENALLSLEALPEGGTLGAGYIYGEEGRRSGWLVRLDAQGAPRWQRAYPRGRGASLALISGPLKGKMIIAGTAEPADGGAFNAGWLMAADPENGNIAWQRYFSGDFAYSPAGLLSGEKEAISLALNAQPTGAGGAATHLRLLSLDPQGLMLESEEYFNGRGAQAAQLILGSKGERIALGETQIAYQIETDKKPAGQNGEPEESAAEIVVSMEGWVIAAGPAKPFDDPCPETDYLAQ